MKRFTPRALGVALFCTFLVSCGADDKVEPYRTAEVSRGDVVESISATGSLQALKTVEVGSQVSGPVSEVLVDFNSRVSAGQTLAILDKTPFLANLAQAQADLNAQIANLGVSQAQIAQATADRGASLSDRRRYDALIKEGFASPQLVERTQATGERADAAVRLATAQLGVQRARIEQARASIASSQVNLGRTIIKSPVDGVVVDRAIDPGQTVAASFNSPVLFRIAQDLRQVRVQINVDEADIGSVREGQAVRFSVDAYPDQKFEGVVAQVRKQGLTAQGVVTYVVMADASNPEEKLLPGMTANAEIIQQQRTGILRVPTAALRWTPPAARSAQGGGQAGSAAVAPAIGGQGQRPQGAGQGGGGGGRMLERLTEQLSLDKAQQAKAQAIMAAQREKLAPAGASFGDMSPEQRRAQFATMRNAVLKELEPSLRPDQKAKLADMAAAPPPQGRRGTPATVYVLRDKKPQAVELIIGGTDGSYAEIISGNVKAGDQLITGGGPRAVAQLRIGGGPPGAGGRP